MNYLVLSFYPSPNPFICLTVSLFPDIDYCSFLYSFLAVEKKQTNKETKQTNKYKNKQTKKKNSSLLCIPLEAWVTLITTIKTRMLIVIKAFIMKRQSNERQSFLMWTCKQKKNVRNC